MDLNWGKFNERVNSVLGRPYKFGAKWPLGDPEPNGPIDCSGFVRWAFSTIGIYIPDGSSQQYLASSPIEKPSLGDLGFFRKNGIGIHHVGIWLDSTNVIEARGDPYEKVILRPVKKWEAWAEFTGWQRLDAVTKAEAEGGMV